MLVDVSNSAVVCGAGEPRAVRGQTRTGGFMKSAVVMLVFCTTIAIGQPAIAVHVGGQVPFSETYSGLSYFHDDYWPAGVSAGFAYDVDVTRWLRLMPGIEYALFPLKSDFTFHGTYSANIAPPSGSGDAFHRLLLNLECRVHWPSDPNLFRPFVEMDGGYLFERIGRTTFSTGQGEFGFVGEREDRHSWAFGFGVGSELWVSRALRVEPAVHYHSSVDDHLYGLLTVSLVYTFRL